MKKFNRPGIIIAAVIMLLLLVIGGFKSIFTVPAGVVESGSTLWRRHIGEAVYGRVTSRLPGDYLRI